jgi:hypothetical protein
MYGIINALLTRAASNRDETKKKTKQDRTKKKMTEARRARGSSRGLPARR